MDNSLETGKTDQRQLHGGDLAYTVGRKVGILLKRQPNVFSEGHRAPQRASLKQHARRPQNAALLLG
jgi:hypothetical protein